MRLRRRVTLPTIEMVPINKTLIGEEEIRAVLNVLRSGKLTEKSGSGPNVVQFERVFSKYVGTKYAVALNSGTAALHAALLAAGVGKDDEVIVPSFTFVATAEVVALTGARPVFADINPQTYCIDPEEVEAAITSRTKAVIPVHLYGLMADMERIMEIARDHSIVVIEDAAQAHGAEFHGSKAGKLGDVACFSFYGSKNMTTGEGGMVTTDNSEYADAIRSIRNHGEIEEYQSIMIGHNYRMPEVAAAIGLPQLLKLPKFLEARRRNAGALLDRLGDIMELQMPVVPEGFGHAWYVFTVRMKGANAAKRNNVVKRIRERFIDAKIYYPKPIHLFPYYRDHFGSVRLPRTETTMKQVFSLPVHPGVRENEINRIVNVVKNALT